MAKKPEKELSPGLRKLTGVVLQIAWILLLLALASYTYRDIPWEHSPANSPAANWMGPLGAYLACGVFELLGLVGFLLPLALAVAGILLYCSERRIGPQLAWMGVMLAFSAVLVDYWPVDFPADGAPPTFLQRIVVGKLNLATMSGGWLGYLLGRCLLRPVLGVLGAALLSIAVLVAGAFFATRTKPLELVRGWKELLQ